MTPNNNPHIFEAEKDRDGDWSTGQDILEWLGALHESPDSWPLLSSSTAIQNWVERPEDTAGTGLPLKDVIGEAITKLSEGMCNVSHPRYFGYISPKPHPAMVLGDLLGSGANQTPGAWRAGPAATAVEVQVLHWLRVLFGLPAPSGRLPGGVFTGGGTLANVIALKLARDSFYNRSVSEAEKGFNHGRVYLSEECHFSIDKAVDLLGIGKHNLVRIPVNEFGAICVDTLRDRLVEDASRGIKPLCIVATAGTTASGAIDDLHELACMAEQHGTWFHVDGASGLAMAALPEVRLAMNGLEHADSITFDPCKWMFASFGVGCLLVRDGAQLADAFWSGGHYWEENEELDTFKMNIYGTRQFRSLGLWCYLRHVGFDGYRAHLQRLLECADTLRRSLLDDHAFELLPQQDHMPIVCFRVAASGEDRCELTKQLVYWCHENDVAYPTVLDWKGAIYARVAISNYTCSPCDMAAFTQDLLRGLEAICASRIN